MTIEYFKKAGKTAATGEDDTRKIVADMLGAIEAGSEAKAREYAEKLDGWTRDIVVSRDEEEFDLGIEKITPCLRFLTSSN